MLASDFDNKVLPAESSSKLPAWSRFPGLRQLWAALTTKGQMENLHNDATRTKLSQPFSKQWIGFENQSLKDIYSEF